MKQSLQLLFEYMGKENHFSVSVMILFILVLIGVMIGMGIAWVCWVLADRKKVKPLEYSSFDDWLTGPEKERMSRRKIVH